MISHPPEPWQVVRYGNTEYSSDDNVSIEHSGNGTVIEDIDRWTAERIVACVNTLAGVPTEDIEKYAGLVKAAKLHSIALAPPPGFLERLEHAIGLRGLGDLIPLPEPPETA